MDIKEVRCMKKNKKIFYDIFSEFNQINKYRELKSIIHHGTTRLDHITRVSKVSFFISKRLGLDYISCTRGAMMHDFFTEDDIKRSDDKYKVFLKTHPMVALDNSKNYLELKTDDATLQLSDLEKSIMSNKFRNYNVFDYDPEKKNGTGRYFFLKEVVEDTTSATTIDISIKLGEESASEEGGS